ncbi:MAG: WYL domain-containing protein, partial [Phenylobacterium sp.]
KDEQGRDSERTIWPVTIGYHDTVRMLMAWCEMRQDFRSFRADRVTGAEFLEDRYPERPAVLRAKWRRVMEERRCEEIEKFKAREAAAERP